MLSLLSLIAVAANPAADRSPVDLLLTADGHLATANQTSDTVSLVRLSDDRVVAEIPVGRRPANLVQSPDGSRVFVSTQFGGDVVSLRRDGDRLTETARTHFGFEPRGLAVSPDGSRLYAALVTGGCVVELDAATLKELARIDVGRWPREMALSPDGSRLAVGVNGDGGVAVVDTAARKRLYLEDFGGLNLGQMQTSRDGKFVYFPWMIYRQNPILSNNIRQGWVMASRIARVSLNGPARREAISLDPRGQAVADPHGFALSPDEQWAYCAASGTQELLVYKLPGLPFQDYGGPGDHIDPDLLADEHRFSRVPLGGRPMAIRVSGDGKWIYIANYLLNAVQVVDAAARRVTRLIALGGADQPSLTRRGEAIFYDGKRSLDQWYSCHSCHYEGHANAVTMDTRNDGRFGNYKTVLSLRNTAGTGPWFWHGWQKDYAGGLKKSLLDSMLGPEPSDADVQALAAFVAALESPPNPYRVNGELTDAARRGEVIFRSDKAGCARCHRGDHFTDNKIHVVGTEDRADAYKGYNTPALTGTYDRPSYLHDGRSKSLEQLLRGPHNPDAIQGRGELTEDELRDLVAYLKSL